MPASCVPESTLVALRMADILAVLPHRAPGYLPALLARGAVRDDTLHISLGDFRAIAARFGAPAVRPPATTPLGLGSLLAVVLRWCGIAAAVTWWTRRRGRPCACAARAAVLDRRFPLPTWLTRLFPMLPF